MKRIFLASVALTVLAVAPAMAADLPARPVYKAPPPVVTTYSWSGCYIGGHGGGVWVDKEWRDVTVAAINDGSHTAESWLAGVQVGCNMQMGQFVFGIQGDYAWTDAEGTHASLGILGESSRSNIESLASVTGRVGYAFDRFLAYVKGGGAWERDEYTRFVTATGVVLGTGGHTRTGWTVGVGGEFAFTNWLTGFVEYNYYDFGSRTITLTNADRYDIDETKSVFKAGLNIKFGGWGPVSARY
jgi:outer membrane immunogenic protein